MKTVIVTGSSGLIGSEAARCFGAMGCQVVGIDNDLRRYFFGEEASTTWMTQALQEALPRFLHYDADIRDQARMDAIFAEHGADVHAVIHTAAQPSHDWAAREPLTDFGVNATGTLHLLEAARRHCPEAAFIFTSTNKVYGDTPNRLPLIECPTRWEVDPEHPFAARGIDESMSIDRCMHSLFGASKAAADLLVQEYGRYFGMKTACFRGGCLTGPAHAAVELHGFLAYLMKCAMTRRPYRIFGYKGKQVRDNIDSADLVSAFVHFAQAPRAAEVYNMGGGRFSNCSMLEAIAMCEEITGNRMVTAYVDEARMGDHQWYVSDISRFQAHYPAWRLTRDVRTILEAMYAGNRRRWES